MISGWMMRCLVVVYIIVAATSAWEHNWYRALYWVCASGLTISVLGGTKL